jgi:hypothetical protein
MLVFHETVARGNENIAVAIRALGTGLDARK